MIWPLLIAGVVFLLALWRPKFGVVAVTLLWPAYLIRTTIAGIPTTALELSIYSLTAATAMSWFRSRQPWPRLPRWLWAWLIVLALGWLTATVFSSGHRASLGALKGWFIDSVLYGGALLYTIRTEADRRVLLQALASSGIVIAVAGLAQLVWWRSTLQDGRLSSFFHPVANYAAMYLTPLILITTAALIWKQLPRWWWVTVGLMTLALILSVSFAGYLALASGAVIIWWFLPDRQVRKRLALWGLAIALISFLGLTQTPYFAEHFRTTDRSSSLVRYQIWRTSWVMIERHPLVGIGPDTFEPVYRATIPALFWPPLEWLVSQPHNLYLALWLETGLLGLIGFVGLVSAWLVHVWRQRGTSDNHQRAILIGSGAAMVGLLVHGLFDTPYFKNDLILQFMVILLLPWLVTKTTSK